MDPTVMSSIAASDAAIAASNAANAAVSMMGQHYGSVLAQELVAIIYIVGFLVLAIWGLVGLIRFVVRKIRG